MMGEVFINAEDQVAGRLASLVAQELLKGESVHVVNADKCVISGNPNFVLGKFRERIARGDPYHGPFYPRQADTVFKRMVRGMLPHRKPRGREALKALRVYISIPEELAGKEFRKFPEAENKLETRFISLGRVCEILGGGHGRKEAAKETGKEGNEEAGKAGEEAKAAEAKEG